MRARVTPEEYYDDGERKVNLWSLVRAPEEYLKDIAGHSLGVAKVAMEQALKICRDQVAGAKVSGRSARRRDYRNGYYRRRRFATEIGYIRDLRVPRCRTCSVMAEFERRVQLAHGRVEEKIVELFLRGVSTRNVGELLRANTPPPFLAVQPCTQVLTMVGAAYQMAIQPPSCVDVLVTPVPPPVTCTPERTVPAQMLDMKTVGVGPE
jgi:hypothetical protein